jgi:hypothetical protein
MRTSSEAAEADHADAAGAKWRPAAQGPADDQAVWLEQAKKVRDQALRLLRERFAKDLESAEQVVGSTKPEALAREADYARKLIAQYLAESEKLFALTSRLLRKG